ncbi:MAG: sigma-70 family RNA polymerase sigma factor [Acidobacteria bacterium]|nr:sigma-70 family RNA polymerase sigma factor [Acidobacteriota bacterium]
MAGHLFFDSNGCILWMQNREARPRTNTVELALQAKKGDPAAFDRLMELEQARVVRMASRLLVKSDDASDAAQEVFLRLYRHIERFDPAQHWDAWVYRICVNVCRDLNRKRRWRSLLSLDAWLEAGGATPVSVRRADEGVNASELRRSLQEGLRLLPEKERAALVLRDVEGLAAAEAAVALGVREATVRSQACRARSRLRNFLLQRTGGSRL